MMASSRILSDHAQICHKNLFSLSQAAVMLVADLNDAQFLLQDSFTAGCLLSRQCDFVNPKPKISTAVSTSLSSRNVFFAFRRKSWIFKTVPNITSNEQEDQDAAVSAPSANARFRTETGRKTFAKMPNAESKPVGRLELCTSSVRRKRLEIKQDHRRSMGVSKISWQCRLGEEGAYSNFRSGRDEFRTVLAGVRAGREGPGCSAQACD